MQIWLLDSEPIYTHQLSSRLQRQLNHPEVRIATSIQQLTQLIRQRTDPLVLLIVSQADFPDLDTRLVNPDESNDLPSIDIWFLIDTNRELSDHQCVPRLAPVHQLVSRIRDWAAEKKQHTISPFHLHFILRFDTRGDDTIRQLLHVLADRGLRLIYLPLMPTTQMNLISGSSDGLRLSTILFRLSGNPDHDIALSPCWQPSRSGWLEFRPPERSDDLTTCDELTLRLLTRQLRETLSDQSDPTCVVIDCLSMPLTAAVAVASLCDSYQVFDTAKSDFTRQSVSIETQELQRKLPSRCWQVKSDAALLSTLSSRLPDPVDPS